jgi:glycine reductase
MTKAIEKLGIPTVNACAIITISQVVGANRIVRAVSIPHPFGDPELKPEKEYDLRKSLVLRTLKALETSIEDQTLF